MVHVAIESRRKDGVVRFAVVRLATQEMGGNILEEIPGRGSAAT
jgi:hypothetical protein